MLKVEMRSLEQQDLVLEESGVAESLGIDLTPELSSEPLEIHCELSKNGDLVLARGWVQGRMLLSCDRCLKDFESPFKSFFEIHYRRQPEAMAESDDLEFSEDEAETVFFDGEILDIGDQVRQTVLLSVPMRALCREGCRGLCGGCGADLNTQPCRCGEPPSDSRWDALRKIKF